MSLNSERVLQGMYVNIFCVSLYIFNFQDWFFMSTGYINKITLQIPIVFFCSVLSNIKTGHMYLRHQVQKD